MTISGTSHRGKNAPVLVTGAGGKLGQLLFRAARACGVVDRFIWQSRHACSEFGHWVQDDLRQPQALLDRLGPLAGILHLAGATPMTAEDGQMVAANVDLALRMVKAAGGRRLLLLSSAAVYGRPNAALLHEDEPLSPQSAYAQSKAEMEAQVRATGAQNACILRLGNVAGADALLGQLVSGSVEAEIPLDLLPDGQSPVRSYIGPGQFLDVVLGLYAHPDPLPKVLNVAMPTPVSMAGLLESWALLRPGEGSFQPRPAPGAVIARVAFDTSALQRLVPLQPNASSPEQIVRDLLNVLDDTRC